MLKKDKGITLIALIVTIIMVLILASISMNLIFGNKGTLGRAKFTSFAYEYTSVNELKDMYVYQKEIEKANTENFTIQDSIYPVSTNINIADISESLKYCIVKNENIDQSDLTNTDLVNLKLVDFTKINGSARRRYAINVINGNLYAIDGEDFDGRTYHTIGLGVNPNAKMTLAGNYELIIDAGEGKIVNWEVLRVFYDKYVPNTLSCKVYTSNDKSQWVEHELQSLGIQNNKEELEIIEPDITRYLKIEVKIESINGENSEISNIMVNYFGYRKSAQVPTVNTTSSVSKIGNLYTIPTSSNGETTAQGTGTVTQTITVPSDAETYVLNSEMIGNPSTTVKVTDNGVTTEYTVNNKSDLIGIQLNPRAQVEITSTLSAGDVIGEVEIFVEDKTTELQQKESTAQSSIGETWKTKKERTYMYNNGGSGFWERSSLNGTNIDKTGIINQGDNRRVKVTYQTSTDGNCWSNEFSNIQDAENIQYLRVRVQYQVFGDIEYVDTSSNILAVILNDGSYKARFYDEDGTTLMFTDRAYFTNRDESAQYTMPNCTVAKTGKIFAGWIYGNQVTKAGQTFTITGDTDFTAKYRVRLDILSQGKASFTITPNTQWQKKVTVTINNSLQDEDTTILQYKIGNNGTWQTYEGAFDINNNIKIFGRFYNTLTQEIGYTFDTEITVIDEVNPEIATITLSNTQVNEGETITATVTQQDNQSGIVIENCKYIVNQSAEEIGIDSSTWNNATAFETTPQEIPITESGETKTVYLHILSVDVAGNKRETISGSMKFKGYTTMPGSFSVYGAAWNYATTDGGTMTIVYNTPVDLDTISRITFSGWIHSNINISTPYVKIGLGTSSNDSTVQYSSNTASTAWSGGTANCELNINNLEIEEGTYYLKIIVWQSWERKAYLDSWSIHLYE